MLFFYFLFTKSTNLGMILNGYSLLFAQKIMNANFIFLFYIFLQKKKWWAFLICYSYFSKYWTFVICYFIQKQFVYFDQIPLVKSSLLLINKTFILIMKMVLQEFIFLFQSDWPALRQDILINSYCRTWNKLMQTNR